MTMRDIRDLPTLPTAEQLDRVHRRTAQLEAAGEGASLTELNAQPDMDDGENDFDSDDNSSDYSSTFDEEGDHQELSASLDEEEKPVWPEKLIKMDRSPIDDEWETSFLGAHQETMSAVTHLGENRRNNVGTIGHGLWYTVELREHLGLDYHNVIRLMKRYYPYDPAMDR